MIVDLTLTLAGGDTGPFDLYSNVDGFITPFETDISKSSLLSGYTSSIVPDFTSVIRIKSKGLCQNWIDIVLFTTTTTSTSTSTTTTTTMASVPCDVLSTYTGGQNYPTEETILLGTNIGEVTLIFDSFNVPDRFIVKWNGDIVIDTGYRGSINYDFGESFRSNFTTSLLDEIDPITGNIYPDVATYPDDGYPRVTSPGDGTVSFIKDEEVSQYVNIEVYGPVSGTAWEYEMSCPVEITTTTTTTVSPTTTTTTTAV